MKQIIKTVSKLFFLTIMLIQVNIVALACSCIPKLTVEKAFLQADFVIHGRIIAIDTVIVSRVSGAVKATDSVNMVQHIYKTEYRSIKMVVEKSFKQISTLPDTVYILTGIESASCGYPFPMFVSKDRGPNHNFQYIVYGHRWRDDLMTVEKQGNEFTAEIPQLYVTNTFFTSLCDRTVPVNKKELRGLKKVACLQ